jgi:phosphoserine aminotransferase
MERVFNFSAGPSTLPETVLSKASGELLNYGNTGMSVMEMSHRSAAFEDIMEKTEALVRELMSVPENYDVLFLQGGASTQFAMIPLNLLSEKGKADYIDTGAWSKKAIAEAKRYGEVRVLASSADKNYSYIPELPPVSPDADYLHITTNNTIYGTCLKEIPETGAIPLAADMSSNIMSETVDVSKFGLIYAGAQKNLGPAGVTLVILKKGLAENPLEITPTMLRYRTHTEKKSMFNTPPCYSIYMVMLVLEELKKMGGVRTIAALNREKAALLYDFLDESDFFQATVGKEDRSLMNIPFILPTDELNARFISEAAAQNLQTLKGHRSVGGMRASIYNAMPIEGVRRLVAFMRSFEKTNYGSNNV